MPYGIETVASLRANTAARRMSAVTDRIRDETELIQTYLAPLAAPGAFGLKDDAALIETEAGIDIVATNDPIISGVHFFGDDDPRDIAWKALAVNASDLAAKGAEPFAYTMALAFPDAPLKSWMTAFSEGLEAAQAAFGCRLIGGDTDHTPGPLSISITALGRVPRGAFVRRHGARVGDHVFVSGSIGDAALGLMVRRAPGAFGDRLTAGHRNFLVDRYLRPQPRLELVPLLRRYATASLDVSDGLLKDAARLVAGSGGGLTITAGDVPLSAAAGGVVANDADHWQTLVSGGDDYELLFAMPPANRAGFIKACATLPVKVTQIGVIRSGAGVAFETLGGDLIAPGRTGYDHFALR